MDGPLFLTLGGAASRPWDQAQPPKYSEFYPDLFPGATALFKSNLNSNNGGVYQSEPVWNIPIDTENYSVAQDGTVAPNQSCGIEGEFAYDNYMEWTSAEGIAVPAAMAALSAINIGVVAAQGASAFNFGGAIATGIAGAGMVALGVGAVAGQYLWQLGNATSDQNNFTECTFTEPTLALKSSKIFMPTGMGNIILEPDSATRLSGLGNVQPALSQLEKPKLSGSHTYFNGNITEDEPVKMPLEGSPMDVPLAYTLYMKNNAPYPYGGPSAFFTEVNPFKATLNAGLSIGGGDPVTPEYLVYPAGLHQSLLAAMSKEIMRFL